VSLRAEGKEFSPAIMKVTPAFFCGKIEEKENQTKSLAAGFPVYH